MHDGRCANGECPVIWTGEVFQNATCRRVFFFCKRKKDLRFQKYLGTSGQDLNTLLLWLAYKHFTQIVGNE